MDHVDFVTQQWAKERPDLDVSSMGIIGRVARLYDAYHKGLQTTFDRYGLNAAKFDVLATLRRSGQPYRLSPGDLLKATMVASGTMTNRIDRLEQDGLVARIVNPADSRSILVGLTAAGETLINTVLNDHVATQDRLLADLTGQEKRAFQELLVKALASAGGR